MVNLSQQRFRFPRLVTVSLLGTVLLAGTALLLSCGGGGGGFVICAEFGFDGQFCNTVLHPPRDDPDNGENRTAASATALARPVGLYSLDELVDRPFVDGVTLRVTWVELEPEPGQYQFDRILQVIKRALFIGQGVTLHTELGTAPAWLLDHATGDSELLMQQIALVSALSQFTIDGIRLAAHPALRQVAASLIGRAGIDPSSLQQAVIRTVDIWTNAFTDRQLYVTLDSLADSAQEIVRALLGEFNTRTRPAVYFRPSSLTACTVGFDSLTIQSLDDIGEQTGLMMGNCGVWSNTMDHPDPVLADAVETFQATYFEFDPHDLRNDNYYSQFEYWSARIKALAHSYHSFPPVPGRSK